MFRLRARDGDDVTALGHFQRLCDAGAEPAETWRSIGLLRRSRGETAESVEAFRRYLELKPGAEDAAIVRTYLERS